MKDKITFKILHFVLNGRNKILPNPTRQISVIIWTKD